MQPSDPREQKSMERCAERLCEVTNELDRLERQSGRAVRASLVALALGWSSTTLVEEALMEGIRIGCVVHDVLGGGYRLG